MWGYISYGLRIQESTGLTSFPFYHCGSLSEIEISEGGSLYTRRIINLSTSVNSLNNVDISIRDDKIQISIIQSFEYIFGRNYSGIENLKEKNFGCIYTGVRRQTRNFRLNCCLHTIHEKKSQKLECLH